ncbi:MAG: Y-family DNA polymerase, partial [Proteobacteria bacterium]
MSSKSNAAQKIFCLIDCDAFYVSCERLCAPELRTRNTLVLSNNDGCVISRCDGVKAAQIKMGDPLHLIQDKIKKHNIKVFSSNYALYGLVSDRVMTLLGSFTPHIEVYSIDESFLSLEGSPTTDIIDYVQNIRQTVRQWIGIPVCGGIGPSKVLAKLANRLAKKTKHDLKNGGVVSLLDPIEREKVLAEFPVADVWGIGGKSAKKLHSYGIYTAKELRDADEALVQRLLTIVGRRIQLELRGESHLMLEEIPKDREQIICAKSFGKPLRELPDLEEALTHYVATASGKLRDQKSVSHAVSVFVETNRFNDSAQYFNSAYIEFPVPTSDIRTLTAGALRALESIYKKGFDYKKVGI